LRRTVTRKTIHAYADASGDHNPLHLDDEFAASTPFGGVIAHGMLTVAYVSQAMQRWLGRGWESGSGMSVVFLKPVRPDDEITVTGRIEKVDANEDGVKVTCAIEVVNQRSETVLAGTAWGHCLPG
jgi:3-hydroxybutyryl-CoA dehydratase